MTELAQPGVQRFALCVEYDGGDFAGWQIQPDQRTVQGCVETALSDVADAPVATICAGRTDAGVHALGQMVHFDLDKPRTARALVQGANALMPDDARAVFAVAVDQAFHARFGAHARTYRYLILNRPQPSALWRGRALWERRELDLPAMQVAADCLIGDHDFSAFRAASCQAPNPLRSVHALTVTRDGPWVMIDITANAFLQNMVRIIVGTLLRVGRQDANAQWVAQVLAARDRGHRGTTAPPHGLYFASVRYDAAYALPSNAISAAPSALTSTIMAP
ncbi:MAG: tRNA pseudouridine(38-40) synthase TruA [Gammaproteobacteria bacterium]